MIDTIHVHPYAAPGVGKSLIAALIYTKLRSRGIAAHLVPEYAKELAWAGLLTQDRQLMIAVEQLKRESELRGKVQVIVTDSPPLLGAAYAAQHIQEPLRECLADAQRSWNALSYMIIRDISIGYEQAGRKETQAEAADKERVISEILNRSGIAPVLVEMETLHSMPPGVNPEAERVSNSIVADVMQEIERSARLVAARSNPLRAAR